MGKELSARKKILYLIFFLLTNISLFAQSNSSIVDSLINQSERFRLAGLYERAFDLNNEALTIIDAQNEESQLLKATILNNFGKIYSDLCLYDKALDSYTESLAIRKSILGINNADYASSLNNIGIVYSSMGQYQSALQYLENSLNVKKELFGENSTKYCATLNNIGNVYLQLSQYDKAMEFYAQTQHNYEQAQETNGLNYASTLSNIGHAWWDKEDPKQALKYIQKAIKLRGNILGHNHPLFLYSLNDLGVLHQELGHSRKALHSFKSALKSNDALLNILTQNNIGTFYLEKRKYESALQYYMQSAKTIESVFGYNHPKNAVSYKNMGDVYFKMGENENAMNCYSKAMEIDRFILRNNFSFLTEQERQQYWEQNQEIYKKILLTTYRNPNNLYAIGKSFDVELLKKNLLLTSEIEFQRIIQESQASVLLAEYEKLKLNRILLNKQYEKSIAERSYNCDSLERVINTIEKELIKKCKEYGDYTQSIAISWQDVQDKMAANDVAIEFSDIQISIDSTIYVALLLKKNLPSPIFIPLCEGKDLKNKLLKAKENGFSSESVRGFMDSYINQYGAYESTALYEAVWEPLEKYFSDSSTIYFVPSGIFHQIAIEYAPVSESQTMFDKYTMYRISSTRNLTKEKRTLNLTHCTLYGGIQYDCDTIYLQNNSGTTKKGMKYLPGTKAEVEEIQRCLAQKNISTTLFEGAKASEESFKALSGSDMTILHIATHGFYLDADTTKYKVDMSMSQTGLMFAGSNLAWTNKEIPEGVEDGILTAKEISHVDLRKTDLVVLSACQTGLGKVTGEGVFGLQRGFKNAGVKTIIMSLWSVDDFATKLMMTEFYTHLADGKSKREAFNLAQAKVRATYEDPYYWAGFIMLD